MPTILQISGTSIAELEAELNKLKAQFGQVPAQQVLVAQQNTGNQLRTRLQELKAQSARTTGRTWRMVHEIADHLPGQFALDDIRRRLNVPVAHVKAWHRNVSRWSKRTGVVVFQHVPGSHHPTKFELPNDVRREVLQLGP